MKNKKGLKHYLKFWGLATGLYILYFVYLTVTSGFDYQIFMSVIYLPALFTFLLFIFDTLFDRIWPNKKKNEENEYNDFLKITTSGIDAKLNLTVEEFRRLRENDKLQKSLHQAFLIYKDGETEDINFIFLEKKFKKNTTEYKALKMVVDEVKKMMVN